ncbi:MAG TPA: FlgD immunoglobulin-like domain containing protein, partial [bacterium]|nr:FlgD immunoglobulin-like domain containing protein [bacterium]
GWVSFTSTLTTYQNDPVPDVTGPNALVAPFWDDLNPNEGGALYYYADAANDRFIVEWDAIPHYGPGDPQTFQVILNDDDSIVYQYETVSQVTDGTVGIENGDGTVGLEVVFNAAYLHDDLAVVIAAADPWLQLSPTSGVIAAGEQEDLTLDFDSTGLPFGEYDANLTINSNDPDESPMVVPVTLTVVDPPTGAPVVAMPTRLSLSRPFPNPFGNRTAIRLEIPAGGANADLSVFDVTGRRVAQLLSGPQPAGFHLVSWDGRDSGGKRVAAGTYFYRFRAGDYEQTRRVVRIR